MGKVLLCRYTTGGFLWQHSLVGKRGGKAWARSWRKRTLAWYVRKGSVSGRRSFRRKGSEARISIVYPGSLKHLCWLGAESLVGQEHKCGDDVSTDLTIWQWCDGSHDRLWQLHLHAQMKENYFTFFKDLLSEIPLWYLGCPWMHPSIHSSICPSVYPSIHSSIWLNQYFINYIWTVQ